MTQTDFLKRMEELYALNLEISRKKNADYANDNNAFQNFTSCQTYGIPVETAIMVRMTDKMSRIGNLIHREGQVKDETILDTLSDLANYSMILRMWLELSRPK